ncbi:uncharacterized protein LOC121386617 isoform X2 [Gigantopelta aegis]|uniref:uncharacterized protein LOC121386617 isoform X2 n=1 Tax=Gigantopelta aegis TaxID=1735272 RepID=UPI001B88E13B|nr:uncharacterized protein LOC121386617 isoform X2 [Gigantopelta aegis]
MNWTLVLLVFVVWSTLHVFAGSDLELSTNLTTPVYHSQFTLICTVTGHTINKAIIFVRDNETICKRYAYNASKNGTSSLDCAKYYNTTTQGYKCECGQFETNKRVYSITIKLFKAVDATQWSCISGSENDYILLNSSVVHLKMVGDPRSNPVLIPAVSAACGAVIVLVIIVAAVCIIKKKRNSRKHETIDTKNDGNNYAKQNNTQGRKQPVMEDNELYFMSRDSPKPKRKPVMIDNDIYNLGNGDEELHVEPEDVDDMDTVVNKHGKTKGDHLQKLTDEEIGAMYAVVKKDTKSVADTKGKDTRTNAN